MSTEYIYQQLLEQLSNSTGAERIAWAKQITDAEYDLQALSQLLFEDKKVALRFSWLLSDVGIASKGQLLTVLPYLFNQKDKTNATSFPYQFAKYWRISGVPEEDKGEAIDLMFNWLIDPKVSTHIKTVSLTVLYSLTKEYPELKNELRLCIEEQKEMSVSFKQTADKILTKI